MRELRFGRLGAGQGQARSLVVFLHGYGANGADLLGLGDVLAPHLPGTAFVAPDAVLDIALSSCHTYLIEGRSLRELCRSLGVPYMALETDYSQLDAGQIDTRIAAFVESL